MTTASFDSRWSLLYRIRCAFAILQSLHVNYLPERVPTPAATEDKVDLLVAIVAWRCAELTMDCLRSIAADTLRVPMRVIVVDNASGDGTAERLQSAIAQHDWAGWAQLLRAPSNGGFASGNNVAIRAALAQQPALKYVLLLNPDTVVRPEAFRILIDFMEAHPEVGVAGGRSEDPDTTPQFCCFRFPTLPSELASYLRLGLVDRLLGRWATRIGIPEQPTQVDWVSGAHMIIRREVIDAIGLMDEGYFLYYEETDFTLRAPCGLGLLARAAKSYRASGWPEQRCDAAGWQATSTAEVLVRVTSAVFHPQSWATVCCLDGSDRAGGVWGLATEACTAAQAG